LRVKTGIEAEFALYRGTHQRLEDTLHRTLRPVSAKNRDFALEVDPRTARYLRLLQEHLEYAGRPIEAAKSERTGIEELEAEF